jgi:hypothetical protein
MGGKKLTMGKFFEGADVLVKNAACWGILDLIEAGERGGSKVLKEEIFGRVRPKRHCFGHIHESNGTVDSDGVRFFNSAICDMKYKPRQGWDWFDLPMGDLEPNDS